MVTRERAETDLGQVAQQVREARTRKRWTRARLAEEVRTTADEIARVEMSGQDIPRDLLARVAAALELDVAGRTRQARPRPARSTTQGAGAPQQLAGAQEQGAAAATEPATATVSSASNAPPSADGAGATTPTARRAKKTPAAASRADSATPAKHAHGTTAHGMDEAPTPQIVALLERVVHGHFVYQDGRAWLLHDADAIRAESPLLAAYALLTDALLAGRYRMSDAERAELRESHRQLMIAAAEPGAATPGQRQNR